LLTGAGNPVTDGGADRIPGRRGVVSILYATEHRKGFSAGWGWMLVSGLLDLVLAVILLAGLPGTAVWALGVLLGVNMIVGGAALLSMSLQARSPAQ